MPIRTLAALLLALLVSNPGQAQEITFFRIGTGDAGGSAFATGVMIADVIGWPPGTEGCEDEAPCGVKNLVSVVQPSHGAAQNLMRIEARAIESGLSDAATLTLASRGEGVFSGRPMPDLRVIARLSPEVLHLVLPAGARLAGLPDLRGQRVGIAQAGSGGQIVAETVLAAFGLTRDAINEGEMDIAQSARRLAAGQLDAFFALAAPPAPGLAALAGDTGFTLYALTPEERRTLLEALPMAGASDIPAGTYPGIAEDVQTLALPVWFVTHADQPEALIHDMTAALWSRAALTRPAAPGRNADAVTIEAGLDGLGPLGVRLHPGAERYYRGRGMLP